METNLAIVKGILKNVSMTDIQKIALKELIERYEKLEKSHNTISDIIADAIKEVG